MRSRGKHKLPPVVLRRPIANPSAIGRPDVLAVRVTVIVIAMLGEMRMATSQDGEAGIALQVQRIDDTHLALTSGRRHVEPDGM